MISYKKLTKILILCCNSVAINFKKKLVKLRIDMAQNYTSGEGPLFRINKSSYGRRN